MRAKYPEKIPLLRVSFDQKRSLESLVLRSGMNPQEVRRALLDISITVYEYFERRGITDPFVIRKEIESLLSKKQLPLPFDSAK